MAIKIFIDQGHNPDSPNAGAVANGVREQDINYAMGELLAERLRANGNFEVRLARRGPSVNLGSTNSESLRIRVQDANSWGADYYISIHCNTASSTSATGCEAFAYSSPSRAFSLGEDILRELSAVTGLRNRGMKVRTNLYVLRKTTMPAVLVELGFLTNLGDVALLRDRPELFAEGIYLGIVDYTGV